MKLTVFIFVFGLLAFVSADKLDDLFEEIRKLVEALKDASDKEDATGVCKCRLNTENRIVGGEEAIKNSIPWQVSLASLQDNHFCGGLIVNKDYVMTSAQCVKNLKADQIKVRVGIHKLDDPTMKNHTYMVDSIISHDFEDPQSGGDIALLKLDSSIKLEEGVSESACLNFDAKEYTEKFLVSGWGTTERSYQSVFFDYSYTGPISNVLKQSSHVLNKDADCKDYNICVKPSTEGDSICQGDSGGPLQYTANGKTTVDGVASFVSGEKSMHGKVYFCNGPSGFTRLSYYEDWVKATIGDKFCS